MHSLFRVSCCFSSLLFKCRYSYFLLRKMYEVKGTTFALIMKFLLVLCLPTSKPIIINNSLLLEHDEGIRLQVREVDVLALWDDVWVFPDHEPADVREEEAPPWVVRVGVCVTVLVMLAVVSHPDVQTVLKVNELYKNSY